MKIWGSSMNATVFPVIIVLEFSKRRGTMVAEATTVVP